MDPTSETGGQGWGQVWGIQHLSFALETEMEMPVGGRSGAPQGAPEGDLGGARGNPGKWGSHGRAGRQEADPGTPTFRGNGIRPG